MSKISLDANLQNLDVLIAAAKKHEDRIPGLRAHRKMLEKARQDVLTARGTRDSLKAATRKATCRLQETVAGSEEATLRFRFYVRGVLGPWDEQLSCFGMTPRRKRRLPHPDEIEPAA